MTLQESRRRLGALVVGLGLLVTGGHAAAEASRVVSIEVGEGIRATARFWPGEPSLPPVLILHGFLQTRDFPTVRRLAESLSESGYPVLTPTLALGIDNRAQSLHCEAIHTHDMDSDVAELSHWRRWLSAETGRQPVLIGHSSGALTLVPLLAAPGPGKSPPAILISLSYFGQGPAANETPADAARARSQLARDPGVLGDYALNYCQRYVTTPARFLSYYDWSKERMAKEFKAVHSPARVIIGSADKRIDRDWIQVLEDNGFEVIVVPGASHFFDQQHEFDLLDAVEGILADIGTEPAD